MSRLAAKVLIAVLFLGVPGASVGQRASLNEGYAALLQCRDIPDDVKRLKCFDTIVLDHANEIANAGSVNSSDNRPPSAFGLSREPARPAIPRQSGELKSQVTRVEAEGRDRLVVVFADRSVWRTSEPMRFDPRVGDPVTVRPAALGSYMASFPRGRAVRVQRIR